MTEHSPTPTSIPTELNIAPRGKSWLNGQLIDGPHGYPTRQTMIKAEATKNIASAFFAAGWNGHMHGANATELFAQTCSRFDIRDACLRMRGDQAVAAQAPAAVGPVLDSDWRFRMLDGTAIERDDMGCGEHSALPVLKEGMKPKQFFDALGIELQCVMAEDQMDMDAYEAMLEAPDYNAWTPTAPEGQGWKQVAIFDTEDGPACWWIREAPPLPQLRHPRNTPAAVEDGDTTTREQYRRMFEAACVDLGRINEALGLDPDDGGADPILDAIEELRATPALPATEPAHAAVGLTDALRYLIEAIEYTPLGIRQIKALERARAAIKTEGEIPATEDSSAGDQAHDTLRCAVGNCTFNGEVAQHSAGCQQSTQPSHAEVQAEPVALPFAILDEEMSAFRRFDECARDGQGYDVRKPMMKRLAEIGLVRRVSADIYEHTTFGCSVINGYFDTAPQAQPADAVDVVLDEVRRAKCKFPTWPTDPLHALAVPGEEFGELTKDMLQLTYEPHKTSRENVRTEAIQTAAMALRLVMSIDRYMYQPGEQHSQDTKEAAWPQPGDLVRYGEGNTALALHGNPRSTGWHGEQCMGGYTFYLQVARPSDEDRQTWVDCAVRYRGKTHGDARREAGLIAMAAAQEGGNAAAGKDGAA